MKHLGTQYLKTEKLILRPFTADDVPAMYRNWACDEQVVKFFLGVWRLRSEKWVRDLTRPNL